MHGANIYIKKNRVLMFGSHFINIHIQNLNYLTSKKRANFVILNFISRNFT
jgi:hypothetical protein